ncbi:hypothetical protein ATB53_16625 [Xanthomonas translucens]|uniref:Uncharacterized protein n=1 Tax=Xanthomonas campestris pv. translucens TaxID=343 RepID=A0A125PVE2_XANCT|nr:hypothetical protein ATB53_16625 [Xanthomonas translucens]
MENDAALIYNIPRRILLDYAHDPSNELDERREVREHAKHRCYGKERVIKTLAQLSNLYDYIQLMISQLLHDLVILLAFPGVHKVGLPSSSTIRFHDLNAVFIIEGGGDNL